jgi:ribose transport system permease protein
MMTGKQVTYRFKNLFIAVAIPFVLYIILLIMAPTSMRGTTIFGILSQAMLPTILAWGVLFACKLGLWHFSAGANVITAIILGAGLANRMGGNVILVAVLILVFAVLIGLVSGLIYIWIKVPSIIATVGCMLILESVSALALGGGGITVNKDYELFNQIPVVIIGTVICFVIAYIIYSHTSYGFNLKAVGNNISVAEQQGINVNRVKVITFSLVGLFAGFYGILTLARSCVQNPTTNMGSMDMVFNAIMCCFVAMALEKNINLIIGVYIGAVTMQLIKYGIVSLGISGQFNNAAVAIALLIFCAISSESEFMVALRSKFSPKSKTTQSEG